MTRIGGLLIISFFVYSCVSAQHLKVSKAKNIPYVATDRKDFNPKRNILDVYYPSDTSGKKKDVILFIHGGGWIKGNKYYYFLHGKNFAKKNVIFVAMNYRLAPAMYTDMAFDAARAVRWVLDHIEEYGGDSRRIFICGHSAGGHLSALVALNREYFDQAGIQNPLRGCILIDAFGLDIARYFRLLPKAKLALKIYPVFTKDDLHWRAASPINYVPAARIPFIHFVGERTFPLIQENAELFKRRFEQEGKSIVQVEIKGKQHIPMIRQMTSRKNQLYPYILDFMAKH